ncbi:MAG TPA: hypothetical protein VF414_14450, partial [Thermoanaerobaculia bacterium]
MEQRFTEPQKRAIQELVGLPPHLTRDARTDRKSVPIDEVRRILDLPDPGYRHLLGPNLWLAGGSILRWLTREVGMGTRHRGDFDLFVPSVDHFNETGRTLLSDGFVFRCFRSLTSICQLCGRDAQWVRDDFRDTPMPVPRMRCPDCGEFGGSDASTLSPDRLLRMTPELIARTRTLALELASEKDDLFHIAAVAIRPSAYDVVMNFDYSVVQFGIDNQSLYFGPHAWTDLLTDRFRLEKATQPRENAFRLKKYMRQG